MENTARRCAKKNSREVKKMKQINKTIIVIFIFMLNVIFICIVFNITKKVPKFPEIKETTIKEMTEINKSDILETIYFEQEEAIYKIKDIYGKTIDSFYGVFDYTLSGPIAGRICNKDIFKIKLIDTQIIINITRIYYLVPNGNIEINPIEEK